MTQPAPNNIAPYQYGQAAGVRTIPAEALQLADGCPVELAGKEATEGASIVMLARSSKAINHWYWGTVVHDMDGFAADHSRIPIDYLHRSDELIGYLNKFEAKPAGLECRGELVSLEPGDRADTCMKLKARGVPYQASISFRPESVEEVQYGATARVNGFDQPGPALIVRKWGLRGVALCPYGADHRTQSQFSNGESLPVAVTVTQGETMTTQQPAAEKPAELSATETKPAATTETQLAAATSQPATEALKTERQGVDELRKFVAKFGAENGATWFAEGISYADALEKFCDLQATELASKSAEIAKLTGDLATARDSFDRGENDPVDTTDRSKQPDAKFAHLGENRAKIAGAIKLPGR